MDDLIISGLVQDIIKWKGIGQHCYDDKDQRNAAYQQMDSTMNRLVEQCGGKDTEKYRQAKAAIDNQQPLHGLSQAVATTHSQAFQSQPRFSNHQHYHHGVLSSPQNPTDHHRVAAEAPAETFREYLQRTQPKHNRQKWTYKYSFKQGGLPKCIKSPPENPEQGDLASKNYMKVVCTHFLTILHDDNKRYLFKKGQEDKLT